MSAMVRWTVKEVAKFLGIDEKRSKHVYILVVKYGLPAHRVGHRLKFDPAEVRAWWDGNRGGSAERHPEGGITHG